jgi:hypothetical protein
MLQRQPENAMVLMPISVNARCMALAAGLVAANIAGAAPADGTGINWACTQERDAYFHVNCVPQSMRVDEPAPHSDMTAPPAGVSDMRPVAARGNAEVFSTKAWRMPLYTQPSGAAAVKTLLEAVLCGPVPDCAVTYSDGQPAPAR